MGDRTTGVVLIGLRRAGKTTVGRQLAEGLGLPFVDLDDVIAERAGRPVADIILEEGEPAFRKSESETLALLVGRGPAVLACGGGTPMGEENRALLTGFGQVLYLRVGVALLLRRLHDDDDVSRRPPLLDCDPDEEVREMWTSRDPTFVQLADAVVDGEGSVHAVASRCEVALRQV
ncbi:MAG: shikimate kinase [Planctomycetes bacterium]|nr:shikimate kinase [Planctomycetota bacterium]